MEPSWSRQIQFGMQGFCSFPLPHRKLTPVLKRSTVHSWCRRRKHMTILKTVTNVIIVIIVMIDIIHVIVLVVIY